MSLLNKLAIPLLDDDLRKEDFDTTKGFVGVYSYNKNRPDLNNHMFLLYDASIHNPEREYRFIKSKNLYKRYVEYINDKPYYIYVFPCINYDLKNLLNKGVKPKNTDNSSRIVTFWCGWERDVSDYMFYKSYKLYNDWESVPEYDYRKSETELLLCQQKKIKREYDKLVVPSLFTF